MARVTVCIYSPSQRLKEEAQLLAQLKGKSFSKMVWDLVEELVENNRDQIQELKKLRNNSNAPITNLCEQ